MGQKTIAELGDTKGEKVPMCLKMRVEELLRKHE